MPGIHNDYGHFYDFLTPFDKLYDDGISAPFLPENASAYIDLRKSTSAGNNVIVVVLTSEDVEATADIKLYVQLHNSSLGDRWILVSTSPNSKINELIKFTELYAGRYAIVLDNIQNTSLVDVHVSFNNQQAQYPIV